MHVKTFFRDIAFILSVYKSMDTSDYQLRQIDLIQKEGWCDWKISMCQNFHASK